MDSKENNGTRLSFHPLQIKVSNYAHGHLEIFQHNRYHTHQKIISINFQLVKMHHIHRGWMNTQRNVRGKEKEKVLHRCLKREGMNWTKNVVNNTNAEKVMQLWVLWLYIHTNDHGFSSLVFTVGQNACGWRLEVVNPIIHRNQRDRARRASMPHEKREEMNKKRRESYQIKKGQPKLLKPKNGDTTYGFLNIYIPRNISHNSYMFLK